MRNCNIIEAINIALCEELSKDKRVFIIGEDVTSNIYGYTGGLLEKFGDLRVRDTPLSEAAFTGAGVGAAIMGERPIIDWTRAGCCAYVSMDQLVNLAAKYAYTYGGQFSVPLVIMTMVSYNSGLASQHSDRPHPLFMNIPGIKIVMPASAKDAYGLLKSSIRDNNPVMFIRDCTISRLIKEDIGDNEYFAPIGKSTVMRKGTDISIVGIGNYVNVAFEVAEELERETGINCEVINPMTMKPFDYKTVINSVKKTGRLLVVDSANEICCAGRDIAAVISSECFYELKGPVIVKASKDVHVPYSPVIEQYIYPTKEDVKNIILSIFKRRPS